VKSDGKDAPRRYSITGKTAAKLSRTEAVRSLTFGRQCWLYEEDGRRRVMLYFKPDVGTGGRGRLYWNAPGMRDEDPARALELASLTVRLCPCVHERALTSWWCGTRGE
jgi:hypothetical protein